MNQEQAQELMGLPGKVQFPPGWQFHPIYRNQQLAGFFCFKDNEIHCFRLETYKGQWLNRKDILQLVKPIFAKFGNMTTKVGIKNEQGQKFVKRLGFYPVGESHGNIHYQVMSPLFFESLNHA